METSSKQSKHCILQVKSDFIVTNDYFIYDDDDDNDDDDDDDDDDD